MNIYKQLREAVASEWADDDGHVTLYHGTALKHKESIKKHGILPQSSPHHPHPNPNHRNPLTKNNVSMTADHSVAKHFTQNHSKEKGEKGMLLKLRMHEDQVKQKSGGWHGHHVHKGVVHPRHITHYAEIDTDGKVSEWKKF